MHVCWRELHAFGDRNLLICELLVLSILSYELINLINCCLIKIIALNYFDWFIVFNATFNNISAISWRPVLVLKKPAYPAKTWGLIWKYCSKCHCSEETLYKVGSWVTEEIAILILNVTCINLAKYCIDV